MRPIRKLLIANRGEIALRIMRTARSLGILSVAVYADDDADSPNVRAADEAVRIDAYLDSGAIVAAARAVKANAVHPGYGFLAENADFAEGCEQAGIVFVGPKAEAIRLLGAKDRARGIARQTGVPIVPEGTRLPMLIKAAAGGGGRGMRIVRRAEDLEPAMASARSEALRSFGNDNLLVESYIEEARHVEVQILGDHHGNLIHLFERDCSVQRRHQKVIEESPSPAVTPELREKICAAAVALGRAAGYTNAGTVEFLLAPSGEFFFIEVNTRLQVEHPVTEMVTGLDLVQLQIEIAEGQPLHLPLLRQFGHAVEARLYAEQPGNNFLPSTGRIEVWNAGASARIDSGVHEGTEVGVRYDPLLAKLIAWAPDRATAIRKLAYALRSTAIGGVETNREYLIQVLEHEDFLAGRAHTAWALDYSRDDTQDAFFANAAAAFIGSGQQSRRILPGNPPYWRNNPFRAPVIKLEIAGKIHESSPVATAVQNVKVWPLSDGRYYVHSATLGEATAAVVPRFPDVAATPKHDTANSPMPGQVLRIEVAQGQNVKTGDPLVVLEAMKMEQTIRSKIDGRIAAILVRPGQVVAPGQMLVEIDSTEDTDEHSSHSAGGG
jgi:acetyl/propionyl-CoA carboxylase alpha subunit